MKFNFEIFIQVLMVISMTFTGVQIATMPKKEHNSSAKLIADAQVYCEDVPELDGKRYYCQAGYVMQKCKYDNLDLKICGEKQ